MSKKISFSYQVMMLTPAKVEHCTGLSTAMQRNWRKAGHLPQRTSGVTLFEPAELVAIRLMIIMRSMGYGPSISRPFAELAAPSVIWLVLSDYPESWEVDPTYSGADQFRHELNLSGDRHLKIMARLKGTPNLYGVSRGAAVEFLSEPPGFELDDDEEIESIIKLRAVARRIAISLDAPLMRVVPD